MFLVHWGKWMSKQAIMTQGATICVGASLPQVNYNTAKLETTYLNRMCVCVCVCVCVCMLTSVLSSVQLFATPWTVAHQAPLPIVFSRPEY